MSGIKRFSALSAAAMLLIASLAACGESESSDPAVTTAPSGEEAVTEAEETLSDIEMRALIADNLPEADYGGYNFRIVTEADQEQFLVVEEATGDVINDAVYERNQRVSERFNCTFSTIVEADYGSNGNFMSKAVLAGEDAFDLGATHEVNTGAVMLKGIFKNWYDLSRVDFSQSWWSRSCVEDLTYSKVCLIAIGDFALPAIGRTYCMFFDKVAADSYGITGIYDTVMDGKWTIDLLSSLTQDIYVDLDGDNQRDDSDYYGFATGVASNVGAYLWAFDNPICARNSDGTVSVVIPTSKMTSILEKLNTLMFDNPGTFYDKSSSSAVYWHNGGREMFQRSQCVFANGFMEMAITNFRELEHDYGVIPYPKWEEAQTDYRSLVDGGHVALVVPMTVQDDDKVGTIIEALNAEGYKTVTPVFIETALKVKYARDNESVQVIDMLIANRIFDFGYVYDCWGGCGFWLEALVQGKKTDFESYYAKNEKKILKNYQKVFDLFESMANA